MFASIARASQATPLQLIAEPQQNQRRAMLWDNLSLGAAAILEGCGLSQPQSTKPLVKKGISPGNKAKAASTAARDRSPPGR
jgi:hypothetical protein